MAAGKLRPGKEQLACLLAAAVMALAARYLGGAGNILQNGNELQRNGFGGSDREYRLEVTGISEKTEPIRVRVSRREYTEEEAEEAFEGVMEDAAAGILGSNPSLSEVQRNLQLRKSLEGHPGIRLSWYPEDPELIGYDGEVRNLQLEGPVETVLKVQLRAGSFSREYALPVTVLPRAADSREELLGALEELIAKADRDQVYSGTLHLPETVEGHSVRYSVPQDLTWLKLLLAGVLAAVAVGLRPKQEERKAAKKREEELMLDYSEVVSKLLVYLGAGLTVRNAWKKIAGSYQEARAAGRSGERAVYEEMLRTEQDLEKGVPERRAYTEFAHRCGPRCYLKLVSVLDQNLRTGDGRLESALEVEMQEAFEQRKNTARRLGEEAGTKLMAPLILSLITVMIIVAVPAMLTLA